MRMTERRAPMWLGDRRAGRGRRELDQEGFMQLLASVREVAGSVGGEPMEVASAVNLDCLACFRDGGCREHSGPDVEVTGE